MKNPHLPTSTHRFVFVLILFLCFIVILWAVFHSNVSAESYDHSQCQYPQRVTNPADACDNSDPCDPISAAKGQIGDCSTISDEKTIVSPSFVDMPVSHNINTQERQVIPCAQ